jgi:membrane-bound lytic murein transglycosylase MltF
MTGGSRQSLYPASWARGRLWLRLASLVALLLAAGMPATRAQTTQAALSEAEAPALPLPVAKLGDFDTMKQRRLIRILVPFSRTIYFLDKGAERGTAAEFGRQFEVWLNKKYKTKALKIRIAFIPTPRDRLLTDLNAGLGDIVAANLTITPERLQLVDFSTPGLRGVKEVVVTGPATPALAGLDDLAGREIHVRKSSSYWTHLEALNAQFAAKGLKEITLRPADEDLEDEDLLEMVNAGLLPFVVVDNHKAEFWAQIFPQLKVREDIFVNEGGEIAWAVRKNSPLLLKEVNEYVVRQTVNLSFFNEVMRKYYSSTRILKNAYSPASQAEYQRLIAFFKTYGGKYDFDYLMIAAQGYQESRLDQKARSHMGAVGIMQLLPSTAADPNIGIHGVDKDEERNIEAGIKYLRHLTDVYLNDPKIGQKDKTLMAFAAYNAGPGNLQRFRKWAQKSGLDPNVWFFNVEEGAGRIVGQETVQYVSNIYKYYVAYKLLTEHAEEAGKAKQAATTAPP